MAINTEKSAKPIGAYVHAKEVDGFVFLSGIGPREPETDKIPDGIEAQTHAVFRNVKAVLEACNLEMKNVVDIMVFLTDMKNDFKKYRQKINQELSKSFRDYTYNKKRYFFFIM